MIRPRSLSEQKTPQQQTSQAPPDKEGTCNTAPECPKSLRSPPRSLGQASFLKLCIHKMGAIWSLAFKSDKRHVKCCPSGIVTLYDALARINSTCVAMQSDSLIGTQSLKDQFPPPEEVGSVMHRNKDWFAQTAYCETHRSI